MIRETDETLGDRAFVVLDANVPKRFAASLCDSLKSAGLEPTTAQIDPSERIKILSTVEDLLVQLTRARHDRTDPVIALGGGVVGDIAGFVAASYRRGVPVVQCPTTLLAMADASVGGKTGVNIQIPGDEGPVLRKNMVGAFHQPVLVAADVQTLVGLEPRILRCGLAECIKHALIAPATDPDLLDWTERLLAGDWTDDPASLIELVARNVAVKAGFVAGDVRETPASDGGGRALLNLGHTFAHAIEPIQRLSPDGDPAHAPLQHGEAVSLGLIAAVHCARHLDLCDDSLPSRVAHVLSAGGLPTTIPELPPADDLIRAMGDDKKVLAGRLRFVLPVRSGGALIVSDPPIAAIRAGIDALRGD